MINDIIEYDVEVFLPENIKKEINEKNEIVYKILKKVEDEIRQKVFCVKFIGKINTDIFIYKESKNKLLSTIKNLLPLIL